MKKYYMILGLALSIAAGCTKSEIDAPQPIEEGVAEFTATIEQDVQSKTILDGLNILWQKNDPIAITAGSDLYSKKYVAQTAGTSTTFTAYSTSVAAGATVYKAYYPYGLYDSGTGKLTIYATTQDPTFSVFPMYAESSTTDFSFKNIFGVMRINLPATADISISSVVVDADEPLSGVFTISNNAGEYYGTFTSGSATKTLTWTSAQSLNTGMTVYIPAPQGSYHNLKITINTPGGKVCTKTAKAGTEIGVERSKITDITFTTLAFAGLDGMGTQANPWQISSQADLEFLAAQVNAGTTYSGKYFALTQDITCTSAVKTIGDTDAHYFAGTFDGNNHTITISNGFDLSGTYASLFGTVKGSIKNLIVAGEPVSISGKAAIQYVSGIAAKSAQATIVNCENTLPLTITTSTNNVYVGGIVAYADRLTITDCVNNAALTHNYTGTTGNCIDPVGGVVGYVSGYATVTGCMNSGNITGKGQEAGGIVAKDLNGSSTYRGCRNQGDITVTCNIASSAVYAGGIAGKVGTESTIINCGNTGNILGNYSYSTKNATTKGNYCYVGGVVGTISGTVNNSFNYGSVTSKIGVESAVSYADASNYYKPFAGGIVASCSSVVNCYTNVEPLNYDRRNSADRALSKFRGDIVGTSITPQNCYWSTSQSLNTNQNGSNSRIDPSTMLSVSDVTVGSTAYPAGTALLTLLNAYAAENSGCNTWAEGTGVYAGKIIN